MSNNIYQRINEIQKAVGYVKKDTDVGFGNNIYKAVSHDAVLASLREKLVEQNIVVVPQQRDLGATQKTGETAKGKDWILFRALYDIKYVCADNPSDFLIVSVEGHGEDQNDKADGKAITYACKMAHLKLFLLATGINDEERLEEKEDPQKAIYAKHYKAIQSATSVMEAEEAQVAAERVQNKWTDAWIQNIADISKKRIAELKK